MAIPLCVPMNMSTMLKHSILFAYDDLDIIAELHLGYK